MSATIGHFATDQYDSDAECDEDCMMCSGEACDKCGAGCWNSDPNPDCDHDVIDRHNYPRSTPIAKDQP